MGVSGVGNNPPPPPPPDHQQVREQAQSTAAQSQQTQQSDQAQKDAAKQAAEAQKAQEAQAAEARRAAVGAIKAQGTMTLPQEFMGVLDGIVQESYEVAKPPEGGKTNDQGTGGGTGQAGGQKTVGQEMQRDIQVMREFVREAKYMIANQGMEVAQMLNTMKVAQGGAFWSKVQQILQKGIPVDKQVLFQKLDKPVTELPKSMASGSQDAALKAALGQTQGAEAGDMAMMNPGQAILELLKAEANPAGQLEHFLAGLYILNRMASSNRPPVCVLICDVAASFLSTTFKISIIRISVRKFSRAPCPAKKSSR